MITMFSGSFLLPPSVSSCNLFETNSDTVFLASDNADLAFALSITFENVGIRIAASTPITAITMINSTSVKPRLLFMFITPLMNFLF